MRKLTISIPILMYHQVTLRPLPAFQNYAVTPKAFAAQMRWLVLAGYVPINLDDLLEYRRGRRALPPRPIITFDDGFQDCIDYAVPILQTRGFTAIFYLVAGLIGQTSRWLLAERGFELPLMSWTAARQLEAAGFQCGEELREARRLLEEDLGHEVRHLAYPFGSFNERVRAIAAETGYRSACTVEIGLSASRDDPLALRRVPVPGQDSLLDLIWRLRTARSFRETLRGKMAEARRRWRRTGANTTL